MNYIKPGSTIGIIGGGQLGRMIAIAAAYMGYKTHVYTDTKKSPASQVANKTTVAKYSNKTALKKFASSVDVATFEFENIPFNTVKAIETYTKLNPGWKVLYIAQNRLREKDFLNSIKVATTKYQKITSLNNLKTTCQKFGGKAILKTTEMGYDGKGQFFIDTNSSLNKLWQNFKNKEAILEALVDFEKEISVIVARSEDGSMMSYEPAENIHQNGILDTSIVPARINENLAQNAVDISYHIAEKLNLVGVLCVEFFVTREQKLLVNELAPRPHNSGHWSIDAAVTSQFEQLVRAICGLPLGSSRTVSGSIMKNLIGEDILTWQEFIKDPDTKVHIYGKEEVLAGRKMGHVTHLLSEDDVIIGDE